MPSLLIKTPDGGSRQLPLEGDSLPLGRSGAGPLIFPNDLGLSRKHLVFTREGRAWTVTDLGSKNGSFVNGERLTGSHRLLPGDRIAAGQVAITYDDADTQSSGTVVFVDPGQASEPVAATRAADLERLTAAAQSGHIRALVNAGRELAGHRPLEELFVLILNLSLEAVRAKRGVLLTLEGDDLVVRAARGSDFAISTAVRDRVLREMESLLVLDVMDDDRLRERESIVRQSVRSIMAVPLRTDDRVIGLIYVDSPHVVRGFSPADLDLLTVMSNVAAVRIEHARLAEVEQNERMLGRELEQAAEIQQRLLPSAPPCLEGCELAAYHRACRGVGGDYYDYFPYADGRLGLVVADVAGKGMPAALLMSALQAKVQVLAEETGDLGHWMGRLNRLMAANCPSNRFITLFFAVLDPTAGSMVYSNAGHNPPIVVRRSGEVELLTKGGMVLGLMPAAVYGAGRCDARPGDMLVLYSDGITEAVDPSGEEFGEERLTRLVVDNRARGAGEVAAEILKSLAAWTAGKPAADDVTLVVAKRS
ncbi:MAG TPA: SpoIIE family protein phosphatase [Bryobacteraceae bacterium]|nr:SpoIIE family protein phosphatase [Bryobacteraceae bacterium]